MVFSREVGMEPILLIAAQPVRGLDIGAIEYIHNQLLLLRDRGQAILLISTELSEIMEMSDRIGVLYHGKIIAERDAKDFTKDEIGLFMAGGGKKSMKALRLLYQSGNRKSLESLWFSLLAIGMSFILVALIMLFMGYNPVRAYLALFKGSFGSIYAISLTLCRSVPLIFVGLAVGFALKGGLFNIGGEGQLYIGGFTSAAVALALPSGLPVFVSLPLAILAGTAAGMVWGGCYRIDKSYSADQ